MHSRKFREIEGTGHQAGKHWKSQIQQKSLFALELKLSEFDLFQRAENGQIFFEAQG